MVVEPHLRSGSSRETGRNFELADGDVTADFELPTWILELFLLIVELLSGPLRMPSVRVLNDGRSSNTVAQCIM